MKYEIDDAVDSLQPLPMPKYVREVKVSVTPNIEKNTLVFQWQDIL